jgi:virulence-associated protein VapD
MANMKTGLSYFNTGGTTETGEESNKPEGALVKATPPKGKYAVSSPIGAVPVGQSTLQNMQRLLDEKQAQQGSLLERLKDAKAVFSGYGQEQTQGMDLRTKQREEQAANIFQMRNQIEQQKAAQAQLQNVRAADLASGWGMPQAGAATPGATPAPTVQSGFSPDVVEQYNRILNTEGLAAANKFRSEQLKIKSQYEFNPALDAIVKFPVGNQMVDMTLRQAKKFAENNPQLQMYLEKIAPGVTSSSAPSVVNKPAAAAPAASTTTAPVAAPAASTTTAPVAAPAASTTTAPVAAPAASTTTAPAIRNPSTAVSGGALPSSADITQRMEIEKAENLARVKGREKEFEKIGENAGKQVEYIESALSNSTSDIAGYDKLNTLVTNNPLAFGVLQNPGILSGALKAVQEGANVGNYNVNIPGVETLVRQAGGTKDDITAANMAIREFAKLQLNAAKLLQGQGSVSDAERQLLKQVAGSASDDPRTIKDMIKWGKARAEYDRDMGNAWKAFLKKNPGGSYRDFYINSPERDRISEAWKKKTQDMLKDYESLGKKPVSGARAELDRRRAEKKKQEGF